MGEAVLLHMTLTQDWLSLADLGCIYGISAIHCGRVLEKQGLRDSYGSPTPWAIEAGVSTTKGPKNPLPCLDLFK